MPEAENSEVVRRFLALTEIMANGDNTAAQKAYRELMEWPREDKEELVFRTDERYQSQKRTFIDLNNRIIKEAFAERAPRKALLLLPFCLQHRSCPYQVVWEIANCRNCGKCAIGGLRETAERHDMELRIAIRSRFAPGFVKDAGAELVLAVACEHELMIGLLRIYPAKCFAIPLERPEGPCKNTVVSLNGIEEDLRVLFESLRVG